MKWISMIIYGAVFANWLMNVRKRLWPSNGVARYVVVALHSMRDDKVIVGYTFSSRVAEDAASDIEELTISYMGIAYDLANRLDQDEFKMMNYTNEIDSQDRVIFDTVRGRLCEKNG